MTSDLDQRIAETERLLIAAAVERGYTITGDLRVSEVAAAALGWDCLIYEIRTGGGWRCGAYRVGGGGGV